MNKFLIYIKPLWEGKDGKISLKSSIALIASIDLIWNIHKAISIVNSILHIYDANKVIDPKVAIAMIASLSNMTTILCVESAFIFSLLGISSLYNIQSKKLDVTNNLNQEITKEINQ
jgi:hypothetical protein